MASFAVSPQQRRLWLLGAEGRRLDSTAVLEINGPLDAERLARAATAVGGCHEVLRTAFRRTPGLRVPQQVVSLTPEPSWEQEEAGESEAAERAAGWLAGGGSWDLESGPVVRSRLVRIASDRHLLLVAMPGLVADAATAVGWAGELARFYARDGCAAGTVAEGEEPLQYGDLASWQNELLDGGDPDIERGRSWWRRLEPPAAEPLPGDRGASAAAAGAGPERIAVGAGAWRAVLTLAEWCGASWRAVPLAAWAALLARLTGRGEAAVAVLFDGRRMPDLAGALGPLSQALPLGWRLDPAAGIAALVRDVERSLADASEQQEYFPGAAENGSSDGAGALARPPYGYAAQELPALASDGAVTMRLRALRSVLEPLALELVATRTAQGEGALELWFDPARFDRAAAEALAARFEALLADAARRPEAPVERLEILAPGDRRAWDAFQPEPATAGEPLHRRFERHAARRPGDEAVVAGVERLTYGELERRANRLARRLLRQGAGPERPVALHLERSADTLVALLAALKAGAAYVPLDPSLPAARRARLLAAVQPAVVVDGAGLPAGAAGGAAVLRPDDPDLAGEESAPPSVQVPDQAAAYVLFTSGSTGEPKGVVVERRNLWSYTDGVLARLDLPPGSRYALASTFAADLGNTMIFAALATGGSLRVLPLEGLTDAEVLAAELEGQGVDCLKVVPSHLAVLLAAPRPERVLPRRCLVLGGEALPASLARRVLAFAPGLRLLNHYGPTETTVGVLTHPVGEESPAPGVPLGRPLPDSRVYLADTHLQPVPVGVCGELVIGGANVARGYLGRPRETAERFVPDPFGGPQPGGRLYRSGDLGRLVPDPGGGHAVTFEGRRDDQVKIRGFRAEPGEVEAALALHPAVAACAVAARGDADERRLVAWVVFAAGASATAAELREHLGERLPEPMVPSVFVPLDTLPLTANGKLDRRALPAPGGERLGSGLPYVAPRNELESAIASIWAEVLGIERVGLHDNFFDLGGTSLTLVQVHGRLRSELGAELPVVELFRYPTVGEQARFLAEGRRAATSPAERRRQAAGRLELLRRQRHQRRSEA